MKCNFNVTWSFWARLKILFGCKVTVDLHLDNNQILNIVITPQNTIEALSFRTK